MTVHLWEGTAHPRSNIEARATFAKDIYNKDSLFSPRIFEQILTRYCNNWRKLYFLHFAQKGFHRQHVTLRKGSKSAPKVFSCSHEASQLRSQLHLVVYHLDWISDYCCRIMTWFDLESESSNHHFIEGKLCFKTISYNLH